MADVALADLAVHARAEARLAISSLLTPLPREALPKRLPGELACSEDWHAVATMLDGVAEQVARRMQWRGTFSHALAQFVADEIRGAAADIRANLALEELHQCMRR